MKTLMPSLLLFISSVCSAAAYENCAAFIEKFKVDPAIAAQLKDLTNRNYKVLSTEGAFLGGRWNDEGLEGSCLVTARLEAGKHPMNVQIANVSAIVGRGDGAFFVKKINPKDPDDLMRRLSDGGCSGQSQGSAPNEDSHAHR